MTMHLWKCCSSQEQNPSTPSLNLSFVPSRSSPQLWKCNNMSPFPSWAVWVTHFMLFLLLRFLPGQWLYRWPQLQAYCQVETLFLIFGQYWSFYLSHSVGCHCFPCLTTAKKRLTVVRQAVKLAFAFFWRAFTFPWMVLKERSHHQTQFFVYPVQDIPSSISLQGAGTHSWKL